MRILFLTTQLPYPPKSGGLIKSWRLLQHWSSVHELSLVHPLKEVDQEHIEEFKKEGLPLKMHFYDKVIIGRNAFSLVKSYLGHKSLNIYRNHSSVLSKKIEDILPQIDLVFVDHYELGQYIPASYMGKVVLHEHNAEYVMWSRLAELENNPLKKLLLKVESKRIAKAEKAYAKRADQVWAAPNDCKELTAIGIAAEKLRKTYHLGEDFMIDSPDIVFTDTEKRILFIGTLTWEANVDGLLWFLRTVWPELKKDKEVNLDIIGKNPDPRLIALAEKDPQVNFLGFIDDLEPYYNRSRVFIVPLRFGSGIKVKLLNALYRGLPTVTTEIGIEGLEVQDGVDLFQANEPELFSKQVGRLLNDKAKWTEMRNSARVKGKVYTWKKLLADHDGHLKELLLS